MDAETALRQMPKAELHLHLDTLKEMALNGIDVAWIDDATKAAWRADWSAETDAPFAS